MASDTSIAAIPTRRRASVLKELVYSTIKSFGSAGCISDEVRRALRDMKLSYSSVTARYASLLEDGRIIDSGHRRGGDSGRNQRVMVAA